MTINSTISTTKQHIDATEISDIFFHDAIIPITNARAPAIGELVHSIIAGKVITDRVIYGT